MTEYTQEPCLGCYGDSVFFNEAERALTSCLVLRGQVEVKVNNGKSFVNYRPISYDVVKGTYGILVDVAEPGQDPVHVQMWVNWGPPPATPKLTNARMQEPFAPGQKAFSEIEKAYSSCLAFWGQVEEKLNKGKPFANFKPISYQAQLVEGTNYKIRVDVSEPLGKWPWTAGGIGPVLLRTIVEMTVSWGLPDPPSTPELTDVKMLQEPYGSSDGKFLYAKNEKPLGDGGFGETVYFSHEPETERAYMSSLVLRGQVEEKLNKGKPFPSYKPISYQAEVLWFEGMNFKILINVTPPLDWPPWGGIGPVIPQTYAEITVHMGLPLPIPELTDAKLLHEP